MRGTRFVFAGVAVVAALGSAALAGNGGDHILLPGQKATGSIGAAGEEDEILFHATAGSKVDIKVKARKGETLLPVLTRLLDPADADLLSTAVVKASSKGNLVRLARFTIPTTGTWVLGISGDASTTGTYDLLSKGSPSKAVLGTGTVAAPGQEVPHDFRAEKDTELLVQVKADKGSLLQPLIARLEGPSGDVDLDALPAVRKTSAKKDQVKGLLLPANGDYSLVVTGANGTTGPYTVVTKVGKKVALDFTEDPPEEPPPPGVPTVSSVTPTIFTIPTSGTESKGLTVAGANFQDGATVNVTAPSGTNGISNIATTFNSSTSLSVTFDLSSTATAGPRTVSVTNPDISSGIKTNAFTLEAPPTGFAITSVSPDSGPGVGGTRVLIQGDLIGLVTAVTFGGVPAWAVNRVDESNVLCTVPPAAALSPSSGTAVDVAVTINGTETSTLTGGFTYDADPDRPSVIATVPAGGATGVATNIQKVVFVLPDTSKGSTVTTGNFDFFRSSGGVGLVNDIGSPRVTAASVGPDGRMLVIQRGAVIAGGNNFPNMSTNSVYVMQVNDSVTDLAGNQLVPFTGFSVWQSTFTTGTATDTTKPTITATTPAANATGVDVDVAPGVTFSEAVDPTTLAAAVTLKKVGANEAIDLSVLPTCTAVSLIPRFKLDPSTTYTISVGTGLRDLSGNALNAAFTANFTTAASDGTAPSQTLTVDDLPQDMNGSGTFAAGTSNGGSPSGSGAATAFDVYLPRNGFTLDLVFDDTGGSGVDPSSFSFTCSAAMGPVGSGQDLSSLFTVTPLGATWTVPATHQLAAGNNITFTANVSDYGGNAAPQKTLAVDVASITGTPAGKSGDRDPFNARQSWLLRFDSDVYTITASSGGSGSHSQPLTVNSTKTSNGTADFVEDLRLVGLNGTESGTNASAVTNGSETGTNAIVQRMVREAVRGRLNERYGIAYDGTRDIGSANIEFLLEGESLAAGGTATSAGWSSGSGYSMITLGGDESANSTSGAVGRATLDFRNTSQEDDSNTGATGGNNLGVFGTHMVRVRINDPETTLFPLTFDPLLSLNSRGGMPVGASNLDGTVLAGSFDYSSATQAQKDRFDAILTAIDRFALYLSFVGAHEIGHSTGLVPDGAPPAGLFGNAHPNNTFLATGSFTTTSHIDTAGPNLMEAASSFDEAVATGADFAGFGPMNRAYLLRRMIYDEP